MRRVISAPRWLALVAALSGLLGALNAGLGTPVDAAEGDTATAEGILVRGDSAELLGVEVANVRDIGFGWVLVGGGVDIVDLNDLDVETDVNTVYQLLDDPLYPDQWGFENTGQLGGTPGADIDAPGAWAVTEGGPGQVVAVLDSGIDLDHPDVVDRLWVNSGEIPGNGVDDDNNGYVDDFNGWDMADDDRDVQDDIGHGTAVASVVAASRNSVGVVGLAPDATVMPVRVCNPGCPLSTIMEGISYALDNGAGIINLSLGSPTLNQGLLDAVEAANEGGIVVAAAAGNTGTNNDILPLYPASFDTPNVIAVAATDRIDDLAAFPIGSSSFGLTSVDLAAPGAEIVVANIDGWVTASGTSFATPMIAGTAALIRALRPNADPATVKSLILSSVDTLPSLAGSVVTGGRLNAHAAVVEALKPVAVASASPLFGTLPFTTNLDGTLSFDPKGTIVTYTWDLPDGSVLEGASAVWSPTESGDHVVKLTVTDNDGNKDSDTVTVHANSRATAVASGFPTLGWRPLFVDLSGEESSDPDGSIVSWKWAAGSTSASGETTTVVLDTVGVHIVTLTVTDDDGATATDSVDVFVGEDFIDTTGSVFRTDIAWMSATGITKGCNPPTNSKYCPTSTVTRGQMAAFLNRALALPPPSADFFIDDDDSIFENDINRIAAAGITKGCNPPTNDKFCPDTTTTRGQMAAFLARAMNLPAASTDFFIDDDGSIFENDINRLAAAGITKGCNPPVNDKYCPTSTVTRGQMAAFLHRADP